MADVASLKWRGLDSITKSYAKSAIYATFASLRCINRASRNSAADRDWDQPRLFWLPPSFRKRVEVVREPAEWPTKLIQIKQHIQGAE
jgi:hypothetical protein